MIRRRTPPPFYSSEPNTEAGSARPQQIMAHARRLCGCVGGGLAGPALIHVHIATHGQNLQPREQGESPIGPRTLSAARPALGCYTSTSPGRLWE